LRPFTLADGERITKPKEKLRYTGIPLAYYDNIIRARFPESWKFWKHDNHGGRTTYHGAPHDTTHINQTPFKDITDWNRMSAHVGHLPDTFDKFLRELGIPMRQVKSTTTDVEQAMKAHTMKMFKMYWKAVRDRNTILKNPKSATTKTTRVK